MTSGDDIMLCVKLRNVTARGNAVHCHAAAFLITAMFAGAAETRGANVNWQVPAGGWSISSNWSGNVAPTTNDSAFIQNGGTASVDQFGGTCGTLAVGSSFGAGTVQMPAGNLAVSSYLYVGPYAGSSGRIDLGGTGALSSPYELIGYAGNGILNQSGGTNSLSLFLYLGYVAASSGTYSLSGNGLLSADTEFIGNSGNGIFSQTGGTNTVGGNAYVSRGYYLLGGGLLECSNSGTLHVANGGVQTAGGTLDCSGFAAITGGTGALLDLTGAVFNTSATTLTIAANSLLIVPNDFNPASYKSFSNSGLMAIAGTTVNVSAGTGFGGWGTVANRIACQGTITAATDGWINLDDGLSLSGTGQVSLGSGTLTVNDSGFSGMSGGVLTASGMLVGSTGTGSFSQSGGTNAVGNLTLGGTATASSSYSLSGGLLRVASLRQGSGAAVFNDSGGTLQAAASFSNDVPLVLSGSNAVFDTSGNTLTLSGGVSGSGKLIKSGLGVLVLSGTNAYAGGTTVNNGKLVVANPLALQNGSDLTIGGAALFHDAIAVDSLGIGSEQSQYSDAIAVGSDSTPNRFGSNETLAVPEPATLALLVGAALSAGLLGKRRR
jgi:fibronectin-binding autotransporter adhesin